MIGPSSMRIVHVITSLGVGGAEMMLIKLLRAASGHRFRHHVVCMVSGGALEAEVRRLGVPLLVLGMRRGRPSVRALLQLRRHLRDVRADIVQTWLYHADLLGLVASKLAGSPPLLWNVRCADMDMSHYSMVSRYIIPVLARLSSVPHAVVTNSTLGRCQHERRGYHPRRWITIPNGFELDRFRPDAEARMSLRAELGVTPETPLVVYLARFDPMKDPANLLRAAARVGQADNRVRFLLVGTGMTAENRELRKLLDETGTGARALLLGRRTDVPRVLAAADLAVSSSRTEGFSNAVGEAMACGIPCVVTDVGDSAAIVGDTGRVVPPGNPDALATAIIEVLRSDRSVLLRMGQAARDRIWRNYDLAAIVRQYEELYESLAPDARAPSGKRN